MAIPVREIQLSDDALSKWGNNVKDNVTSLQLVKSPDFLSATDNTGTHLKLHPKHKWAPNSLNYVGNWNPSSSYAINDVVSVYDRITDPSNQIIQDVGKFFDGELDAQSFQNKKFEGNYTFNGIVITVEMPAYVPIPGTYVCVANVPDLAFGPQMSVIYPSLRANINGEPDFVPPAILPYLRFSDVNYFPIWPEPSFVAALQPGNSALLKGAYWRLLSLLPTQTFSCLDGNTKLTYQDMQARPTGSSFVNSSS